jgi:hypothetical protein
VRTDYTYDSQNRLTGLLSSRAGVVGGSGLAVDTILRQSFVLNADGTRASVHEEQAIAGSGGIESGGTETVTDTSYDYDGVGRLKSEASGVHTVIVPVGDGDLPPRSIPFVM